MSLDLGFLCSIIAVAHIQSVESFGSTAFYFSFLNILFKFSCSPQTNIAQIFITLENNYIIIFLVNCLYLLQLKIFYDMHPITCSRPRSCLPLFIFYTCLIFIGEIIAGKLCFYSQEVRIQHVFGISIRINVFIYKLLICVHFFLKT